MPRLSTSRPPRFLIATFSIITFGFLSGPLKGQSQSDKAPPTATRNASPFHLNVKSNLVVVRVVVRDGKGSPVEGLKKEDFKLFDGGKEQSIVQFDVETSSAPAAPSSRAVTSPSLAKTSQLPSAPPAMPRKFVALYFDDLTTPWQDVNFARNAAERYLAAHSQQDERIGIFTSEKLLSDFTADPQQLQNALSELRPSAHSLAKDVECPRLSDYQAFDITQFAHDPSTDAWTVAIDDATTRGCMGMGDGTQAASEASLGYPQILALAHRIVDQSQLQSRSNLQELDQVVTYLSQMPGQRTIIMVTSGFLSQSEQPQLDRLIDHALRQQVVISALDAKGLAILMNWLDVERTGDLSRTIAAEQRVESAQEMATTDVMAELAQGTGGEFFHNNNDLKAGFGALAGSPLYYILAFSPSDVKLDGKFHSLKVTLAERQKNITIQARRGYFAPKNEVEAEAESKHRDASDAEAQTQEQIREALYSRALVKQFPVTLFAQRTRNLGETRDISFSTHLDTTPLHLRKAANQNANTVIFALAIFDEKGHLIGTQQKRALVHVPDSQMQTFLKTGMDAEMTFNLKPGPYTVREVVTDMEEHHMAALSHDVKIP